MGWGFAKLGQDVVSLNFCLTRPEIGLITVTTLDEWYTSITQKLCAILAIYILCMFGCERFFHKLSLVIIVRPTTIENQFNNGQ